MLAPAAGPALVLTIHISTQTYGGGFLDTWRFDATMGGLFSVIPSYLLGWLVGIPAYRYARRQDITLTGWRVLLIYGACGAGLGIVACFCVTALFEFDPDIIGQREFLAAIVMGAVSGLCLWFMAVWRNPDFGYGATK